MTHFQPLHKFTATPQGILLNGLPLDRNTLSTLPPQSARYIGCAEEILATLTKEDWDNRTPHDMDPVPPLAKAQRMLVPASPVFLDKTGFNPADYGLKPDCSASN